MLNTFKVGLALVATLAIASCGDNAAPKKDVKKSPTITVAAPVNLASTISMTGLAFNGANEESITTDTKLVDYVLDMSLTNLATGSATYNDFGPPMPMRSDVVAIYDVQNEYRFIIEHFDRSTSEVRVPAEGPLSFRLANIGDAATLIANGETVWTGARTKPISFVILGKGHKQRFWMGDIDSVKICNVDQPLEMAQIETLVCS